MGTKAYSYLRFSSPKQMHGDSRRRQTALAQAYASEHGLILDDDLKFHDLGVSAYRSKNAKAGALRAFLEAVENGLVPTGSLLLVESLDRISRDQILSAQGLFLQIIEAGVTLVTLMDGRRYSVASINANPFDLVISLMMMMRANEESATKGRRLREAWVEKRVKALSEPMTAKCPAWLRLDKRSKRFVVREAQADVVRRIFRDALAGVGQLRIARALNAERVPMFRTDLKTDACWHGTVIGFLLRSTNVIGTMVPNVTDYATGAMRLTKQTPIPGYYPAIVSQADFQAVQAGKARTEARWAETIGRKGPSCNILARLARCPDCGHSMLMIGSGQPNWRYLTCYRAYSGAGCRRRSVRYPEVERAIVGRIGELIGQRLTANAGFEEKPTARLLGQALAASLVTPAPLSKAKSEELATAAGMQPIDHIRMNLALRAVLRSVTMDHANRRLLLAWQDGAVGELREVWPPGYMPVGAGGRLTNSTRLPVRKADGA